MPIEVERAREGGANVCVFVRNGIAYLTLRIQVVTIQCILAPARTVRGVGAYVDRIYHRDAGRRHVVGIAPFRGQARAGFTLHCYNTV